MKKTTKILTLILILSSVVRVFACSCVDTNESISKKVQNAYAESDLIIIGKIIDKKIQQSSLDYRSDDLVTYTLELTEKIKGKFNSQKIEIKSYRGSEYCGFIFEIGKEYLIYSYKNDESDFTDICTRTKEMNGINKEELKVLKKLVGT